MWDEKESMTERHGELLAFWEGYLATLPPGAPRPALPEAWYFCDSRACADELGALVVAGIKTATAGLFWSYEAEEEPLPQARQPSIVTDWEGRPLCVIETTEVQVLPFDEVGAQHAYEEGEGDRSLAYWREVHWRFFGRECAALGRTPSADMPVVCERFRLVHAAG